MWIHIIVFLLLLIFLFVVKQGKNKTLKSLEKKDIQIIIIVIIATNVLGLCLTITRKQRMLDTLRIEKDRLGIREEQYNIEVNGRSEVFKVEIPGRQNDTEETIADERPPKSWRDSLNEEIQKYNEVKNDPDYYYLPVMWNGQNLFWKTTRDTSGMLLSAFGILVGVMLMLIGIRNKTQVMLTRQEQMLLDYPGLIMKFTLLVQAGLSVRKTFQKIAVDYSRSKSEPRWAYEEIIAVCYEMESGISESDAYHRLGERCGQVKYKVFSALLVQNLHMGSAYLAAMLEQEATSAWDERKRKARILGEVAATKLLVPMIMMMFVVMAIIMIPAFLSFYGT